MFDHPDWHTRPLATAYRLLTCNMRQRLGPLHNAVIAYDEGRSRLQVDVRTDAGCGLYRFGHRERDIQLIRALLSPGDLFVDGGAHIGLITLVGAAKVGHTGKVIAFEPASFTRQALLRNLELSGFGWVEVRSEALADTSGERAFTGFSVEAWGSSCLYRRKDCRGAGWRRRYGQSRWMRPCLSRIMDVCALSNWTWRARNTLRCGVHGICWKPSAWTCLSSWNRSLVPTGGVGGVGGEFAARVWLPILSGGAE